jgi:UDP-glucuronate decarboxylase
MLKDGYFVIGIDNFFSGNIRNISALQHNKNFLFINADIRKYKFDKLKYKIDYIVNCACPASPLQYKKNPIFTLDTCYNGTKRMLDLACLYAFFYNITYIDKRSIWRS